MPTALLLEFVCHLSGLYQATLMESQLQAMIVDLVVSVCVCVCENTLTLLLAAFTRDQLPRRPCLSGEHHVTRPHYLEGHHTFN